MEFIKLQLLKKQQQQKKHNSLHVFLLMYLKRLTQLIILTTAEIGVLWHKSCYAKVDKKIFQ